MVLRVFVTQPDFTCILNHVHRLVITIQAPVGTGGRCANRVDDVKVIQTALNRFDPVDGGPSPRLDPDGNCGRLTKAAILHFQEKWKADLVPFKPDGVIDVNGPSIARLRKGAGAPASAASLLLRHRARIVEILTAVQAALTLANSALLNLDSLGIGRDALAKVERHFHVQTTNSPLHQLTLIQQIYLDMQRAIGHTPQGPALVLDEPPRIAVGSFMFAAAGGFRAHLPTDLLPNGLPPDSIYLCPRSRTLNTEAFSYALIHELSHFVGPETLGDVAYFHKDQQAYRNLTALQALQNADSYSQFAFDAVGKPDFRADLDRS